MDRLKSSYFLIIVAILLIMSLYRLGALTLFDVDEAVFAQATKEMVQSGDLITPTYNGNIRYDKPIFFYWLMAASYKAFGINEFGARFPSALCGILLCLSLFLFVSRLRDEKTGFYAALSMAVSLYYITYSHAAVTDMVLTLFVTLSLLSFIFSITAPEGFRESPTSFIYGLYLFSALAFLTKGLIGVVFPFGIVLFFLLLAKEKRLLGKVFTVKGVLLFLAVSAPWYAAMLDIHGREFIEEFFIKHHFRRYTAENSGHSGAFYYYVPVLIAGLFPWVAFLPAGIRGVFRGRSPEESERKRAASGPVSLDLFFLIWLVIIFLFFSFSTTKLPNYILPAVPAASVLISSGMTGCPPRWRKYSYIAAALLSAIVGIALLYSKKYLLRFGIGDTDWTIVAGGLMVILSGLGIYAALAERKLYGIVAALMLPFLLLLSLKALPIANQKLQGTLYRFSLEAKGMLDDNERIIAYRINFPSIVFYSDRLVRNVDDAAELSSLVRNGGKLVAIAKAKDIEIFERLNFSVKEKNDGFALLEKR